MGDGDGDGDGGWGISKFGADKNSKKKIEGQSGHGQGNKLNGCSF